MTHLVNHRASILLVLATAGPVASVYCQVLYGSLVGSVVDPANAPIVGARLTLENSRTGLTRKDSSDERGAFAFRNLPEGVYRLDVSASGFQPYSQANMNVSVSVVNRTDVQLKIGTVNESVKVEAQASSLQTDSADVHAELPATALANLPITGYRNYQSLLDLVPGATPSRLINSLVATPERALGANINGASSYVNATRVDGAPDVDPWLPSHTLYVVPEEAIETVNIATGSFDAEQGMAGGAAVTVITKSGTNEFHGSAFEYFTNSVLSSRNFFFVQPVLPKNIQNQYGGTVGGPIRKNKLFFFGSYEGMKQRQTYSSTLTVATPDERLGNFGASGTTLYDPATGTSSGTGRSVFPSASIPTSRLDPIALKMQALVPAANLPGLSSNYFVSAPLVFNRDNYDAKVNWNMSSHTAVFAKYSAMNGTVIAQPDLGAAGGTGSLGGGGAAGPSYTLVQVAGIGVTETLTPHFVMDGNIGFSRRGQEQLIASYGTNFGLDTLGIPGTNGPDIRQSGLPTFSLTGFTSLGEPSSSKPAFFHDNSYTYSVNAGWTRGAHNLRFGLSIDRRQMNQWQPQIGAGPRGGFTFNGAVTALNGGPAPNQFNSYAAFLLGLPQSASKSLQNDSPMSTRSWGDGLYARDQWQATRKLTVTLGTRWEYYPLMTRAHGGIERYDLATNQVYLGGIGSVPADAGTSVSKKLFAPRLGIAYRLTSATVIRAGYGISIDPYPVEDQMRSPYPVVIAQTPTSANSYTPVFQLADGIPPFAPVSVGNGIIGIPANVATTTIPNGFFRRGYIESFNFTVQRQLPSNFAVQAGYVGTRGIRVAGLLEGNPGLVPGAGAAGQPLNVLFGRTAGTGIDEPAGGATNYNSLQVRLDHRFAAGLMVLVSYTYSKSIDWFSDSGGSLLFLVPSEYARNRAASNFDRTQNLEVGTTWELPFGKGRFWLKNSRWCAVVCGWQLSAQVSAYTGLPFTVSASSASLNAPSSGQVADQILPSAAILGGIGIGHPYFDPNAFQAVTKARFGNAGRNSMRGPGLTNANLGLFRTLYRSERWSTDLRAEAYNFTNTPHFGTPGSTVGSGTFGLITATSGGQNDSRFVRIALRIAF